VARDDSGARLDHFLARSLPGASRAVVRRLIADGLVLVDGRARGKGCPVAEGEVVEVRGYVAPGTWAPVPAPDLDVEVVHEDEDLVAVNKPPHLPCHPLRPDERRTVASALVALYPELAGIGTKREAGLVHRLDTTTSGVLVFARRPQAYDDLVGQLRGGSAEKEYLALVEGDASGLGVIETPLVPSRRRTLALQPAAAGRRRGSQPASSRVEARERLGGFTLVAVTIRSGRRHQVRAHLATAGHPIAGDRHYGARLEAPVDRPFLHAAEVRLVSPSSGLPLALRADLFPDLATCLVELRSRPR